MEFSYKPINLLPSCERVQADWRDCKTCTNNINGKFAGTEKCHECMWESKYESQAESEEEK